MMSISTIPFQTQVYGLGHSVLQIQFYSKFYFFAITESDDDESLESVEKETEETPAVVEKVDTTLFQIETVDEVPPQIETVAEIPV